MVQVRSVVLLCSCLFYMCLYVLIVLMQETNFEEKQKSCRVNDLLEYRQFRHNYDSCSSNIYKLYEQVLPEQCILEHASRLWKYSLTSFPLDVLLVGFFFRMLLWYKCIWLYNRIIPQQRNYCSLWLSKTR